MSDRKLKAVVCGSFKRGRDQLMADIAELKVKGVEILSPRNVHGDEDFGKEQDGFVFLKGEEQRMPSDIEADHLVAIKNCDFVWLHTTDGQISIGEEDVDENLKEYPVISTGRYLGPSAAFEIGMAYTMGIPIYTRYGFPETALRDAVNEVASPAAAVIAAMTATAREAPAGALNALQAYYKRVCIERGWAEEDARDGMLLLTEELGELARAVRRKLGIARQGTRVMGTEVEKNLGQEMADVQLYLLHLANILDVDLAFQVYAKELVNAERFALRQIGEP